MMRKILNRKQKIIIYEEDDLDDDRKYEYIQIRVSKQEKEEFKKLAQLQHLTVSSLVRWLVLGKYKNWLLKDCS